MSLELDLCNAYYAWLRQEALGEHVKSTAYDDILSDLHDIPFYWTIWLDENRSGDATTFRQSEFLSLYDRRLLNRMDQLWLGGWATAAPSVLEVLLGMARRWSFYFEDNVSKYFFEMVDNLGLLENPSQVRYIVDTWLTHQFDKDGTGSPFPIKHALPILDMRKLDIWGQMNAYSAEHYQ